MSAGSIKDETFFFFPKESEEILLNIILLKMHKIIQL